MTQALTKAKVQQLDHHLRLLHKHLHAFVDVGPKRPRLGAATLTEMAKDIREIATELDLLALSPFLKEEVPDHHDIAEPRVNLGIVK